MKFFMNKKGLRVTGYRLLKVFSVFSVFSVSSAFAQKPGDMISGNVSDDIEPLMMVNVVEIDATNRIVAHGVTDINGNFSFRIVNPKNKLRISYVGYVTQTVPIKGTSYNIKLKSATQIKEVVVKAVKKTSSNMSLPIPERELSVASQSIDMKEFEGLGLTSVDEALQGRISGLDIVANSGNLGAGTTMRLRGVSSINGNSEPLIVVDGNIFESDYKDGFDYNSATEEQFAELLNVNPDDIATINVLKDAAGTALYGSQGANGVIEIKTKRGSRGKTRLTYSYRATLTHQPKGIRLLDGDHYTMLMKEAYYNPKLSDAASNIIEFNYDPSWSEYEMYNNNTDWRDAVSTTGLLQKHNVGISGGGEKANFRISAGYDHQTGTVIEQRLDRFTTRVALDYFVSDRIKFVTNFNLTYTNNEKNYSDLLTTAYQKMPNLSIYEQDAEGNDLPYFYHMLNDYSPELSSQYSMVNPVALAHEAKNDEETYQIQPEFQLVYNLLGTQDDQTQLKYEGKVLFNIFNKYNDTFYPSSLVTESWSSSDNNKSTTNSHKSTAITTTHTLTFIPAFKNTDHSFMALGRFQLTDGTSKGLSSTIYGLPYGDIESTAAAGIPSSLSTTTSQWRSVYLTFSAHYAYKGKYIADFTVRRDGSTKFGDSNRWGNFPALSLRWNISDEPFMEKVKWVNMLSIRPGWGIAGTPPGSEYLYFSRYQSSSEAYNGVGSIYQKNIRLNSLQWEEKETWNLGFDFGFFDNLITGDVNVYTQQSRQLLMYGQAIPSSSGFASLDVINNGKMRNNGWEFNIRGNKIINKGKFSADVNVTFANNRNELTDMDATLLSYINKEFSRSNGSYLTRVQLNNPFGSIYGFRYKGVYQYSKYSETEVPGVSGPNAPVARDAEGNVIVDKYGLTVPMVFCYDSENDTKIYEFKGGDAIYEDINHDGQINELDIVYLGSSLPKITGGWGFRLTYGRWSWNNQFNFRIGNKIINGARMNAESMYNNNNQSAAVNWRWRVEGDNAPIPRALYNEGYNWLGSDRFMEDGSFLRLNYSQISYTFDNKLIKNLGLSQLRIDFSANNLFCITKYSGADPEIGYGSYSVATDNARTPRAKTYQLGVTVTF